MNIDLSKRLIDCTLGEYIAAERTIGIISGWVIAFFTVLLAALGRYLYKRWKKKQPEPSPYDAEVNHYRQVNGRRQICKTYSPDRRFVCTLDMQHEGQKHEACDEKGEVVANWE